MPMQSNFTVKLTEETGRCLWFAARTLNRVYAVSFWKTTKEIRCECMGATFKLSGKEQKDCRHVEAVRAILALERKPERYDEWAMESGAPRLGEEP